MSERNYFDELLGLLSYEDLLRLARRAQIRKNEWLVGMLIGEIERRDEIRKNALPHESTIV